MASKTSGEGKDISSAQKLDDHCGNNGGKPRKRKEGWRDKTNDLELGYGGTRERQWKRGDDTRPAN